MYVSNPKSGATGALDKKQVSPVKTEEAGTLGSGSVNYRNNIPLLSYQSTCHIHTLI